MIRRTWFPAALAAALAVALAFLALPMLAIFLDTSPLALASSLGDPVARNSTIRAIEHRRGRSGALTFVTVVHAVEGPDGLAIEEEQDLVYREPDGAPAQTTDNAPVEAPAEAVEPDPVLLFRYSALTMNSHRIHYDRPYAIEQE